ncbi:PQQ-binding-like beta-propeller repeat protein [Verrucomicrobiota bacterium]
MNYIYTVIFVLIIVSQTLANNAEKILKDSGVDGGVFVHVGCNDPELLMALRSDNSIVQGLDSDDGRIIQARKAIAAKGKYGLVSVEKFDGKSLPYISDSINLLVAEKPGELERDEIMRVLCPGGVAYLKGQVIVKPLPGNTSDWSHFLYNASGNAVSPDSAVDLPYNIQWMGGPKWARSHDRLSSLNSLVSSDGKIFYIFDEGLTDDFVYPAKWQLIARDAYNGIVLWKRDISKWEDHWRSFRSGPNALNRRVVSADDRVFSALGIGKPVEVIDAATGKTLLSLKGTEGAEEIIYSDGVLYLVILPFEGEASDYMSMYVNKRRQGLKKKIMAIDPASGKILWEKHDDDTLGLLPLTLICDKTKVYYQVRSSIISLDRKSGKQKWKALRNSVRTRSSYFSPALLVYKDVVLSVDRITSRKVQEDNIGWMYDAKKSGGKGELVAFSADTGTRLWSTHAMEIYGAQMDCFVVNDLVYVGQSLYRHGPDFTKAYDVHTGEVKNELDTKAAFTDTLHHRCYRNKATCKYIIIGRIGIEFIDYEGKIMMQNAWTRGSCEYGVMPANGLVYAPPHSCGCYIQVKLSGFFAYSPKNKNPLSGRKPENKLIKGPDYARVATSDKPGYKENSKLEDWPTYRHDALRSGGTKSRVSTKLKLSWKKKLSDKITSPVVAGDKVFVASKESHTLYAMDRKNGNSIWEFKAGARIDSPPSVVGNAVYFGSRDGWVYALTANTGDLAWKFRAAKSDRKHCVFGQLESVWPVHGSVLTQDESLYFAAGRSSYIDDGLYLYKLDARTGEKQMEQRMYSRDPATGAQADTDGWVLPGGLSDILASDGNTLFMRDYQFHLNSIPEAKTIKGVLPNDMKPHVHNTAGYLDDTWAHRTYWYYGKMMDSGYAGWSKAGVQNYSGRIMVRDETSLYGYGRTRLFNDFVSAPDLGSYGKREIHLYRAPAEKPANQPAPEKKDKKRGKPQPRFNYDWTGECLLHVRAMALAGDKVLVAGVKDILKSEAMTREAVARQAELLESGKDSALELYSANDGARLAAYELPARPVFDGMAVAHGCVFITTENDELLCFTAD